jgi:hypothetical protein
VRWRNALGSLVVDIGFYIRRESTACSKELGLAPYHPVDVAFFFLIQKCLLLSSFIHSFKIYPILSRHKQLHQGSELFH